MHISKLNLKLSGALCLAVQGVGHKVGVGEHDPLGVSGSPACVENGVEVVRGGTWQVDLVLSTIRNDVLEKMNRQTKGFCLS